MIEVEPGTILVIFVSVPLAITVLLATIYNFRSLHRPVRNRESIYECAHCGHIYAIARNRPMDRCPKCGNLNDAVRT